MKWIKAAVAAVIIAAAAAFFILRKESPELFRRKTEMEKQYPVCVIGVSEPTGVISAEKAGIRNIYINWKTSFPASAVKAIRASGAVPMITWEPYLQDLRRDTLLPAIAGGKYDAYIARFARQAGGGPVFIRFGHEPNSDWYGWSGVNAAPELYVKAFRRVRKIFLNQNNVTAKFVFSVNAEDVPAEAWNRFENYYPGDDCADVIGIDAYNWGGGQKTWQKWVKPWKMFGAAYERTVKAFPLKPVFLTETASCSNGGDKVLWIGRLLGSIGKRFPAVKAVIWFNINKERDWALSSDEMRAQFYGSCGAGRFECSDKSLEWLFTPHFDGTPSGD
ncbi:MAG: glycosyl hydrolase [Elusimicrobia bacterium]|nr:glycosyl hydrolase [Elusimicrobiota bacterium]